MRILRILLPMIALQNCTAQPVAKYEQNKDDNTLLWEISGREIKKPSYLFGTFHLMCKEDINLSENLKNIIKNSEDVYFEMDLDDPANTFGALLVMNMKDGKRLKDLYSEDDYARVSSFFRDSLNTPLALMERMKPLFLQAMLYPKMMSCNNMSGMEQELMKLAKEYNKEIKGFETIAFQASVFDSIPYEVQAKELLKSIDSLNEYQEEFDSMLNVYKTQHLSEMETMVLESDFTGDANTQEYLLDRRNINWVTQMEPLMNEKPLFIAVGAGHLVGKKGLLNLLREKGYILKPIKNQGKVN